ncbi:hypothetical protein ABW21_db0202627 [Orbilia brochopaga]|nr:hypothetical protein ABW21_db0202627 [Drechslerella brochopaga]
MNSAPPPLKIKKPITSQIFKLIVLLVTLPYHRFFLYNTLKPTEIIERFAPHGTEDGSPQREKIYDLLKNWRERKKGELEFISIAGVAITAIVTATLSWGTVDACHWIGIFFFYASLITSIIGMLLAAQQSTLLTLLGEFPENWKDAKTKFIEGYIHQLLTEDKKKKHHDAEGNHVHRDGDGCYRLRSWRVSWQMVFVWQIPMMAVGYSFLFYIIGLTVLIVTPLIKEPWGDNSKIAVGYLVISGLAWGIFIYCSLFGYRNVSLDNDNVLDDDEEDHQSGRVPVQVVNGHEITQNDQKVGYP